MTERTRDKRGRFGDEYPDSEFLDAIESFEDATTRAVASAVGCDRTVAYRRLMQLDSKGVVSSRNVGSAKVWKRQD